MRRLLLAGVIAAVLAVGSTGCATFKRAPQPEPIGAVDTALLEAASRLESALRGAAVQRSGYQDEWEAALPPELRTRVDVEWHGELHPVIEALASVLGFSFREIGARPSFPILVRIEEQGIAVGAALRSAGQQAGQRADVIVRMGPKQLEVLYRED